MFTLKEFLRSEVKPALGCTEPGAIALAVARACQELSASEEIKRVEVEVSDSIYKNGMTVGIPGADGARGNEIAAALALLCGKADYGLEVLKDCQYNDILTAKDWVKEGRASVKCNAHKSGIYIKADLYSFHNKISCIIEKGHSNITKIIKSDQVIFQKEDGCQDRKNSSDKKPISEMIRELPYINLTGLIDELDRDDEEYIREGISMNLKIAKFGLDSENSGFGRTMRAMLEKEGLTNELGYMIRFYSYAASDARMSGVPLPVMSSAGSGNHGIVAILPVAIVGERYKKPTKEIIRAITLSHLATSYVKSRIGRLSPVCGCSVAAGAGAAAGITFLLGGSIDQSAVAIKTLLANTAGMICDGAKESCALKVGTAASEAYLSALFSLEDRGISSPQGVVASTIEETINNIGLINREGMKDMDKILIDILKKNRI